MESSEIITELKNKIITELINDDDIITGLGLNDDETPDDLTWNRIYPHDYIPQTETDVRSYISVEIDIPERRMRYGETASDIWIHPYVMFRVLVHQEDMQLNLAGESCTRMDYLSKLIERKFNKRGDFGVGTLRRLSNTAGSVNTTYRYRLIVFETVEAVDVCG